MKVVQRHSVAPLPRLRKPTVSAEQLKDTNRNDDVFSLDELVKSFTQVWLQIASQASKSESVGFGGILSNGRIVPSLGRTKRYSAVHCGYRL